MSQGISKALMAFWRGVESFDFTAFNFRKIKIHKGNYLPFLEMFTMEVKFVVFSSLLRKLYKLVKFM